MNKYIPAISYMTDMDFSEHRLLAESSLREACTAAEYAWNHGVWVPNDCKDTWILVCPDMIYQARVLEERDDG